MGWHTAAVSRLDSKKACCLEKGEGLGKQDANHEELIKV
jgi:hypothetical protein